MHPNAIGNIEVNCFSAEITPLPPLTTSFTSSHVLLVSIDSCVCSIIAPDSCPFCSPPLPLPYRPQSAGPILRPHYSQYHHHRLTTGSHNNLRDFMRTKPGPLSATTTANLGGSMGMGPLAAPSPQVHQNQPSAGQHHNHHHNQQQLQFLQHHPHHQQQHQAQQRLSNSVYGRIESTNNQVIKSLLIPNIHSHPL